MNTFLLTYRVFTDSEKVLNALKKVFYDPPSDDLGECDAPTDLLDIPGGGDDGQYLPRRTSEVSDVSGKWKRVFKLNNSLNFSIFKMLWIRLCV